jgi:D-glycero-D-manno-heptose 1,7-bisphosphate phosphatase
VGVHISVITMLRKENQRAVFFDRDGVLNQVRIENGVPYPPRRLEDFHLSDGIVDVFRTVKELGFLAIVATNQPDVARNVITRELVDSFHKKLLSVLPIDGFRACFHTDEHDCVCRKPKPGMLLDAAEEFGIDLKRSYMIGDRWRDVGAGRAAGVKTIWIDYGYAEERPLDADWVVPDVREVLKHIK